VQVEMQGGESLIQHEIYVPEQDTFLLEVEHFLDCLRTGSQPITSGRAMRLPLKSSWRLISRWNRGCRYFFPEIISYKIPIDRWKHYYYNSNY
jgi:hypothetical protein